MFSCNGEKAIVDKAIQPGKEGRVSCLGTYWFARCEASITLPRGVIVQVVNIEKITLIVEPLEPEGRV